MQAALPPGADSALIAIFSNTGAWPQIAGSVCIVRLKAPSTADTPKIRVSCARRPPPGTPVSRPLS